MGRTAWLNVNNPPSFLLALITWEERREGGKEGREEEGREGGRGGPW